VKTQYSPSSKSSSLGKRHPRQTFDSCTVAASGSNEKKREELTGQQHERGQILDEREANLAQSKVSKPPRPLEVSAVFLSSSYKLGVVDLRAIQVTT